MLHQNLRAVMACPDADAVRVKDLCNVVGMNAVKREREDPVVLFCLIAAQDVQMGDSGQGVKSQLAQVFFPLGNGVKPQSLIVLDGGPQTCGSGGIDGTGLELVGQFRPGRFTPGHIFDHLTAGEEGGHLLKQLFFAI